MGGIGELASTALRGEPDQMGDREEPRDRDFIGGLAKGLRVIECFDAERPRLAISDVARMTDLPRAVARRCLLTLVELGYAEFDGKFFALTPRILRLGYAYLAATPMPRVIQPFLERLAEETDESSSASILDGAEIVYVARAAKRRVMSIGLDVGSRLPAYCSSMGRVMLAAHDDDAVLSLVAMQPRRRLTPKTKTGEVELMAEIGKVRSQGFAVIDEELELGLRSIAVPILDHRGRTVAAINVGAQAARVSVEQLEAEILPRMRRIADEVRRLLA